MGVEGALRIELHLEGDTVARVAIASTRPIGASRVFHGMAPAAALMLMPRLFSVCGTAQACAAAAALEAAQGIVTASDDAHRRRLCVLLESAQEHLWRLCVDGAPLAGRAPLLHVAAAARRLLPRLTRALFPSGTWQGEGAPLPEAEIRAIADELDELLAAEILGVDIATWMQRLSDSDCWWHAEEGLAGHLLQALEHAGGLDLGAAAPAFLPPLDAGWLGDAMGTDDFLAAPTHDGECCETTPLARQWHHPSLAPMAQEHGTGLATRFTALLLELAQVPQQLRAGLAAPGAETAVGLGPGTGLSQVEAARGRLAHRVQLDGGGTILGYRILAPTEWNFHPAGLLPRALRGRRVADAAAAKRHAELMVQAIDPCVGFEVHVHA